MQKDLVELPAFHQQAGYNPGNREKHAADTRFIA